MARCGVGGLGSQSDRHNPPDPDQSPPTLVAHPMNPRVHLAICTHTTRSLAPVMAAIARQVRPPDTVFVSCDVQDAAIDDALSDVWDRVRRTIIGRGGTPPPLVRVWREYQGQPRPSQVRNNALRAMEEVGEIEDRDQIVGIDGDIVLTEHAIDRHAALAASGVEFVIGFRVELDGQATAALTTERIFEDRQPWLETLIDDEAWAQLDVRHHRYERHLAMRRGIIGRLGLIKPHKPKIISAHYAVSARAMRAVNGFDEQYVEYGYEDDDLARRLHGLRPAPKSAIAVRTIPALHLWHPTRAPARPTDAPGYARFKRRDLPIACERGWRNPVEQGEVSLRKIG